MKQLKDINNANRVLEGWSVEIRLSLARKKNTGAEEKMEENKQSTLVEHLYLPVCGSQGLRQSAGGASE